MLKKASSADTVSIIALFRFGMPGRAAEGIGDKSRPVLTAN